MTDVSMRAAVVTVSDRSSRGEREDISGPVLRDALKGRGVDVMAYEIVPDERDAIAALLVRLADQAGAELILTTGGTGLAPRDVTPEATSDVIDRTVPGIVELMRSESTRITPHGMLSRAAAGARGGCLIVNMPGSPKAAKESLDIIWPALPHAVDLLNGRGLEDHAPKHGHAHRHEHADSDFHGHRHDDGHQHGHSRGHSH